MISNDPECLLCEIGNSKVLTAVTSRKEASSHFCGGVETEFLSVVTVSTSLCCSIKPAADVFGGLINIELSQVTLEGKPEAASSNKSGNHKLKHLEMQRLSCMSKTRPKSCQVGSPTMELTWIAVPSPNFNTNGLPLSKVYRV